MFYKVAHNRGEKGQQNTRYHLGDVERTLHVIAVLPPVSLGRLLHHAETVLLKGSTCRMKDRIETLQPSS